MTPRIRPWISVVWDTDPIAVRSCRFALIGARVLLTTTRLSNYHRLVRLSFAGIMRIASTRKDEWRYIHEITYFEQAQMHAMAETVYLISLRRYREAQQ